MVLRRALLALTVIAGASPAVTAQEESPEPGAPELVWAELLERDQSVGFSGLTVASALGELALPDVGPRQRSLAMMALGCARAVGERARIESWAVEGETRVRAAAILALGEMGAPDPGFLVELAQRAPPELAPYALLALARSKHPVAVAHVERVAADPAHASAEVARDVLAFVRDPAASRVSRAARVLLELRYAAARRHGLVRGRTWRVLRLDELCDDELFLDGVIFRAASELRRPGIGDHFLEQLCPGGASRDPAGQSPAATDGGGSAPSTRAEAIRGAVNALPDELSQLVDAGLWEPPDEPSWSALLAEIDQRRLEGLTDKILERALDVPGQRGLATLLLVRGGHRDGLPLLEASARADDVKDSREREWIAEGLGGTGLATYIPTLRHWSTADDRRVAAAALVAGVRLDSRSALARLTERLAQPDDPGRGHLLATLCRSARDARIQPLLLDLWPRLEGEEAIRVATALAAAGRSEARASVREALRRRPPSGALGLERIAALEKDTSFEELALLRELFPREDEPEVNAALARVLVRAKDAASMPVLRAALWRSPWNRSVLAGALFADVAGIDALRLELAAPPRSATESDLRRAGFALGEWGGLAQVEELGSKSGPGDPRLQGALLGALSARTH